MSDEQHAAYSDLAWKARLSLNTWVLAKLDDDGGSAAVCSLLPKQPSPEDLEVAHEATKGGAPPVSDDDERKILKQAEQDKRLLKPQPKPPSVFDLMKTKLPSSSKSDLTKPQKS
jgi:hypothetical protein